MRSLLPLSLAAALFGVSCASPLENAERAERQENARVIESRRMNEISYAGSERGAELLVVDKYKAFNLDSTVKGSTRSYGTGSANVKEFNYEQKVTTKSFASRGFWGAKPSAFTDQRFATRAARTSGNYEIPGATKKAESKTAATKSAREADLAMKVRTLSDGSRQYLGKEKKKMETPLDPREAARWQDSSGMATTGGEIGASTGGRKYVTPAEQYGQMKEISVQDLRELLNKNK